MNRIAHKAGRVLLLAGLFLTLATIVRRPPAPPPGEPAEALVTFLPVTLDPGHPERRRIGALEYLRGWDLDSDEPRFGGISAMHIETGAVTAISDAGDLLHFPLPRGAGSGRLRVRPLPDGPGSPASKLDRDTEAMLMHGGHAWVAFERHNMVWRFGRGDWRAETAARPEAMRRWRRNSGAEAMVRLGDGRFLVLAEGLEGDTTTSAAVLFDGDPAEPGTAAVALRYRRAPGFRVTDAVLLPDGRVLVLSRRFSWLGGMAARLEAADLAGLDEGGLIEPREIAELRPPLTVDNMEALSVTLEGGRTIVRIASDDNFIALQRTLLLEFALVERAAPNPSLPRRRESRRR